MFAIGSLNLIPMGICCLSPIPIALGLLCAVLTTSGVTFGPPSDFLRQALDRRSAASDLLLSTTGENSVDIRCDGPRQVRLR